MKRILVIATVAMMAVISAQAQIKRSDAFRAKYELKEVVVMSRHNIRSPLRNTSRQVSCPLPMAYTVSQTLMPASLKPCQNTMP